MKCSQPWEQECMVINEKELDRRSGTAPQSPEVLRCFKDGRTAFEEEGQICLDVFLIPCGAQVLPGLVSGTVRPNARRGQAKPAGHVTAWRRAWEPAGPARHPRRCS